MRDAELQERTKEIEIESRINSRLWVFQMGSGNSWRTPSNSRNGLNRFYLKVKLWSLMKISLKKKGEALFR